MPRALNGAGCGGGREREEGGGGRKGRNLIKDNRMGEGGIISSKKPFLLSGLLKSSLLGSAMAADTLVLEAL